MRATEIDERIIAREQTGADFVVFVYEGGDAPGQSWSVASASPTRESRALPPTAA